MLDMGGTTAGVEDIDALLGDLSQLMDRLTTIRSAPATVDARNVFQRVIGTYLGERPLLDSHTLQPLRQLAAPLPDAYTQALADLQKAEELYRRSGDDAGLAIATTNAGTVYAAAAAFPEALERYARGLALFTATGDLRNRARCISNIGVVQTALPDYMRAFGVLTEALQLMHYVEFVISDRTTNDLYQIFELLRASVRALEQYTPALAIVRR